MLGIKVGKTAIWFYPWHYGTMVRAALELLRRKEKFKFVFKMR